MKYARHGHAAAETPEYRAWGSMISRCYNVNHPQYKNYGARGITICDEWKNSFIAFFNYMGQRPSAKHSIDRIDNDLGYAPGNCRWATSKEQNNNKRGMRIVEIDGKRCTLTQAVEARNLLLSTVSVRLFRGWSLDRALNTPSRSYGRA